MPLSVYIQPFERGEALEAYAEWLSQEQVEEIEDAPDTAIIRLDRNINFPGTTITIIEEG